MLSGFQSTPLTYQLIKPFFKCIFYLESQLQFGLTVNDMLLYSQLAVSSKKKKKKSNADSQISSKAENLTLRGLQPIFVTVFLL